MFCAQAKSNESWDGSHAEPDGANSTVGWSSRLVTSGAGLVIGREVASPRLVIAEVTRNRQENQSKSSQIALICVKIAYCLSALLESGWGTTCDL